MSGRTRSIVALLMFSTMPGVVTAQPPPGGQTSCGIQVYARNLERHVYGDVTAECTYGCPWFHDSHAFGNWGVDSCYANRGDSQQYKGWSTYNPYCDEHMDNPEWNSCTTDLALTLNRSSYWNYANNTQQYSADETTFGGEMMWFPTNEDTGCSNLDGTVLTLWASPMQIYELDPILSDDYVTTLTFDENPSILLSCGRENCQSAATDAIQSHQNDITSALIRFLIYSWLYVEGKG